MSSYLRSVVTWDERQTHRGVRQARVQQQPHIHQHLYGEYLVAMEKAQRGEGGGAGGSKGHSV